MLGREVHLERQPTVEGASDIWSLGCILYELQHIEVPFHRMTNREIYTQVVEKRAFCRLADPQVIICFAQPLSMNPDYALVVKHHGFFDPSPLFLFLLKKN